MKVIILFSLLIFSMGMFAQDQTVDGNFSVGKHKSTYGEGNRLYLQGTAYSYDPVWLAKYTPKEEITDLRINVGDAPSVGDRFIVGTTQWDTGHFHEFFIVRMDGNIGIGVAQPTSKLDVAGTIRAKEVKIEATGWPDFVFSRDYKLPSLSDVEKHIRQNGRLSDIPSEKEVKENGIDVGDMQAKLLQKIEELTLYVIDLKKENESQGQLIKQLQEKVDKQN